MKVAEAQEIIGQVRKQTDRHGKVSTHKCLYITGTCWVDETGFHTDIGRVWMTSYQPDRMMWMSEEDWLKMEIVPDAK